MKTLHIISQNTWEYSELSQASNYYVQRSFGLDIPAHKGSDIWRIPQEPLVRFLLSGARIALEAPGPHWLDSVPESVKGRFTATLTALEVLNSAHLPDMMWKFAEAKNSEFLCEFRTLEETQNYIKTSKIPLTSYMQCSQYLNLGNEYRFFVIEGQPVAGSLYLSRDQDKEITIYDGAVLNRSEYLEAFNFLEEAISQLSLPTSLVIDVAITKLGQPILLEANPSWCSAWYDAEINLVAKAIEQSQTQVNSSWAYVPDEFLLQKYANYPKLKILT